MDTRLAAITRHRRRQHVAGIVDIAARVSREGDLLPPGGQLAQIPFGAGKGALGILALGPAQRERVDLELQGAAEQHVRDTPAIIDFRQRDRLQALVVAEAQRLHRPSGDRKIAVAIDSFEADRAAQPIILRNVVAGQKGTIGRDAQRTAETPFRAELEARDTVDIAAKRLGRRCRR